MNRLFNVLVVITIGFCLIFADNAIGQVGWDANEFARLLDEIKTYDFGQGRAGLNKISEMIRQAGGADETREIEKQLDEFLKSDATCASKQFVCKELSIRGTEASVPALSLMLTDENTCDMARYALERIPGNAVDEALRETLPKAGGNAKVGIINTIGVRGDRKSVGFLADLVTDANQTVACAAIAALGRIGDPCATEVLARAKDKATGALRLCVLDAYLQCADQLASKGQNDTAFKIYEQLCSPGEPMPVRVAAVRGMILTSGDKAGKMLIMLRDTDAPIQTAAIATLKDVGETNVIKAATEQLPNLAPAPQTQLLTALAECGDRVALPAVLAAAENADESVCIAALNAIGALGDASTVEVLVQTAVSASGGEQRAARDALYRLRGIDVDRRILKKLPGAEPKAKVELIRSCAQRNISAAVPILMKTAQDADGQVRVESIKALRVVAGPQDLSGLIELLITAADAERSELERTIVAVAHQVPADKNPAERVLAVLPAAEDLGARCSLLSVLGKIGDPAALPVLRESLSDKEDKVKDAAVRALSDWPTAGPAADLLKVAKESQNQVHKALALRGYIRLTGLASDRPVGETFKMYKEAMALAPSAAEKRMVLSGLANVDTLEALQLAGEFLNDAELKQEAEAAVVKIAESTIQNHPQETKQVLQKVLGGTTSESVREQAQGLLKKGR